MSRRVQNTELFTFLLLSSALMKIIQQQRPRSSRNFPAIPRRTPHTLNSFKTQSSSHSLGHK